MQPTVLFVDDEPGVTESLRRLLRRAPFSVVTANSAAEAVEVLTMTEVAVIVSDDRMPGTSGTRLLASVRQDHPDVVRILLTGQASVQSSIDAVNHAAVFRFLTKPCERDELRACLDDALAEWDRRRTTAPVSGLALRTTFEEALATVRPVYQPIWSFGDDRVHAYEALMRTEHTVLASPDQLIDVATTLSRLVDLDQVVRARIVDDLHANGLDHRLFVNMFPESLADAGLLSGDDPLVAHAERVTLEITERAALHTVDDVDGRLARLRQLGFRLALDDLGAGYAGLTSFATMKPDAVKFDMELVRDIHRSGTRQKLVSSMTSLCRELGIDTIAEGIESTAEAECLRGLGCDLVQGYAIARPGRPWPGPAAGWHSWRARAAPRLPAFP